MITREKEYVTEVYDRLKKELGAKDFVPVAEVLRVKPETLYSKKSRGSFPYEALIDYAVKNKGRVDLNYVLQAEKDPFEEAEDEKK